MKNVNSVRGPIANLTILRANPNHLEWTLKAFTGYITAQHLELEDAVKDASPTVPNRGTSRLIHLSTLRCGSDVRKIPHLYVSVLIRPRIFLLYL